MDWKNLNAKVIEEFRTNGGKVAQFGDLPVVILHTIGAKSGRVMEIPLVAVLDDDEMLLFGSNAGSGSHPVWIFNLRANPQITVEYGSERFLANVTELDEVSRQQQVKIQSERTPRFADYVSSAAPRQIPVFAISRV